VRRGLQRSSAIGERSLVLGINAGHDSSACLLVDGQIAVAIAEERLSRIKHHEGYPHRAVAYCLEAVGIPRLDVVDAIALNEYASTDHAATLRTLYQGPLFVDATHHALHAYYAWVASGFEAPAILIADGSGYSYGEYLRRSSPLLGPAPLYSEMAEAESAFVVSDGELQLVWRRWGLWDAFSPYYRFPSLGHMFSAASQYIFGSWTHAGKTMGLAPLGDAAAFPGQFVSFDTDGLHVDTEWVLGLPPRSARHAHHDPLCRNLAARVQTELEWAMLKLVSRLHQATAATSLCLSGGVALNSVANGRIVRESDFSRFFITPAAGDSGISIGAAAYAYHRLVGRSPRWSKYDDFHGVTYSAADVAKAVDARAALLLCDSETRKNSGSRAGIGGESRSIADSVAAAVTDLAAGAVIGWFEGGSEFGPRALGHRSILADARAPDIKDRLNRTVKFREDFRPYAVAVLAEHVTEYLLDASDDPFMLTVAMVRPELRARIPAGCHVDGSCRLQTVAADHPGMLRPLLERFRDLTGLPLLLNTSFNIRGEPLVETVDEALECFLSSDIDVLYIEGRRFTKIRLAEAHDPAALVARVNAGMVLVETVDVRSGGWTAGSVQIRTRTGHRAVLDAEKLRVFRAIDGATTVGNIARMLGETVADVVTSLVDLQYSGFVAFATTDP
jgi:carbamoyltransferase